MKMQGWNDQDFTDFMWKLEDDGTQADTFIEWCFEQKSNGIQNGDKILNAWRARKEDYISHISSTVFDFQHYSQHDVTHSIQILNSIELVLGRNRVKLLSASDLWLLLECAYFHDIGMALNNEEIREVWKDNQDFKVFLNTSLEANDIDLREAAEYYKHMDNLLHKWEKADKYVHEFPDGWPVDMERNILILTAEFIRKKHPLRAMENMSRRIQKANDNKTEEVIGERLCTLIGKVSELHGGEYGEIHEKLKYQEAGFGTDYLHPQFAAVMLRLGDLLDMDNNRFNIRSIEHFGSLPYLSELHYKKHKALTNFCINERQIMAEAYSDLEEVCQVTSSWFQMLESEVNNLICDWNLFVPLRLSGCMMRRCKLKIYCGNRPFDMKMQKNFEVDKQRLINLMVGSNIYDSGLDCFREYIQNAFDACKMKLWYDVSHARTERMRDQEMTPFTVDGRMYEELAIELHISVKDQNVCFTIRDYGVGMEEECIQNLSVVGRSWKKRVLYQDAAARMPAWMKPTGGFGIGIQSAFMLTDRVKILTRSIQEIKGHELIMDSPNGRGTVTRSERRCDTVGTKVSFEVPLEKITGLIKKTNRVEVDRHTELNLSFHENCEDCFKKENQEDYLIRFFMYYLSRTFPDALFPIRLYQGEKSVYTHKSLFASENGEGFRICNFSDIKIDGKDYQYFIEKDMSVRIWDASDNTFICVKSWPNQLPEKVRTEPMLLNALCYKGVRVEKLREEDKNFRFYDFLAVCIDFMGLNMSDVMALERNLFAQNFDIISYYKSYIRVYLEIIYEEQIRKHDKIEELQNYVNLFLFILAAIQLLEKKKVISIMESCNSKLQTPDHILIKQIKENTLRTATMKTVDALEKIRTIFDEKVATPEKENAVFLAISEHDRNIISFMDQSVDYNKLPLLSLENLLGVENSNGNLPDAMVIPKKVTDYINRDTIIYMNSDISDALLWLGYKFDITYFRINEAQEYTFAMINGFHGSWEYADQKEMTRDSFLKEAFQWSRTRYIAENISCPEYDDLRVDALPMHNSARWFGKRKELYLISPISNTVYLEVLKVANIQKNDAIKEIAPEIKQALDRERFEEIVTGDGGYAFLIEWVYAHQSQKEKLDKEEIQYAYLKMIRDIYDRVLR